MRSLVFRSVARVLLLLSVVAFAAWSAPLRDHTWQLPHADPAVIRAADYDVTEIQLSHGIIKAIDQINDDVNVAKNVNMACDLAHALGMDVTVWAKELNIGEDKLDICLDPDGDGKAMWTARREAYRKAFEICPDIDGVVLQFGSCPTEVWSVRDNACPFNARTLDDERVALTIRIVKEVCDAFGKRVDVRTFNHSPAQLEAARSGIAQVPGVRAMIKEVPQDWQVYYPLNPVIGKVGGNDSFIEIDLGAEYWGDNVLPFAMPAYLSRRIRAMQPMGISGVVVRVERGSRPALGTTNEINLYAMQRLVANPEVDSHQIIRDWVQQRYGLEASTDEARAVMAALGRSFDVGRKMHYVLGQWALEKSSDIPERSRTACLKSKNTPQWDPRYQAWYDELRDPTEHTLLKIWQEKAEAVELATKSLADIERARPALKPEDYTTLHRDFANHLRCARVWQHVTDGIFRQQVYKRTKRKEHRRVIEHDLRELEALADASPEGVFPANPARIRRFVKSMRGQIEPFHKAAPPDMVVISDIRVSRIDGNRATLTWKTSRPAVSYAEFGESLPEFTKRSDPTQRRDTNHVHHVALPDDREYVFRVVAGDIVSGDYPLRVIRF
jgi:hypothetical protein